MPELIIGFVMRFGHDRSIGVLPSMDMGAVWAIVAQRTAGSISLRQLQCDLSLQNSTKHRRLLLTPWYQKRWGKRFKITQDQNTKTQFDTSAGGSRISTSALGSLLGIGGDEGRSCGAWVLAGFRPKWRIGRI